MKAFLASTRASRPICCASRRPVPSPLSSTRMWRTWCLTGRGSDSCSSSSSSSWWQKNEKRWSRKVAGADLSFPSLSLKTPFKSLSLCKIFLSFLPWLILFSPSPSTFFYMMTLSLLLFIIMIWLCTAVKCGAVLFLPIVIIIQCFHLPPCSTCCLPLLDLDITTDY